jgi:serine phosphatase RsbU (regulator of sigma subunit)
MLYGEVHSSGQFRFVNFGHPPPLVFSGENLKLTEVDQSRMVQFLPLGLRIPEDYPERRANSADVAEITLMTPGDVLFLYTDGVHNGRDDIERQLLEAVIHEHCRLPAKDICNALLGGSLATIRLASEQSLLCVEA